MSTACGSSSRGRWHVGLYGRRPPGRLGGPSDTDVEQLMAENEELKRQKGDLEKKIDILETELQNERAKQS